MPESIIASSLDIFRPFRIIDSLVQITERTRPMRTGDALAQAAYPPPCVMPANIHL
jgi:hypothetical protein